MSLSCYKYQLPFSSSLKTSKRTFNNREGLILTYSDKKFSYYGEAAPLPGFSTETLDEVLESFNKSENDLKRMLQFKKPLESLHDYYKENEIAKSLQFGLDTLAVQIQADEANHSIQEALFEHTIKRIPINALVSLRLDDPIQKVQRFADDGFQTIKCKVGMDFESEFEVLKNIRSHFPKLNIRLDANRAWSLEQALQHCKKLERLDIEYCEEPLRTTTPENFESLSLHTEIPLAMDESILNVEYWPNLLPFTSYIILKPMLLGSFTTISETKRLANTHDNKAVFTTSLESGIGRTMTAILASGLGTPSTAHGLSTGNLLAEDLTSDVSSISNGYYHLKNQPSIKVDLEQIEKLCTKL